MALRLRRQCNIPGPVARPRVVGSAHDRRCYRPAGLLLPAPRHCGAAADQSRHSRALAGCAGAAGTGARISDPLSRPVSRGQRALHRLHAGGAGGTEMADGPADAGIPRRPILIAAAGCERRPHPAGSRAGAIGRSGRAAAGGLAGVGALRTDDCDHPQPARGLDSDRQYAVRAGPALFALADHTPAAPDLVHADGVGRSAVHAAGRRRLVSAVGDCLGAGRRGAVAAVRGGSHCRSDQAGLSRHSRAPRTHTADPGARAGAGTLVTAAARPDVVSRVARYGLPAEVDNGRVLAVPAAAGGLLVAGIEIVARRCGCAAILRARTVRPAATSRKAVALTAATEAAWALDSLLLRAGDERGQPVHAGTIRYHRLGLRLWLVELRLRAMFAVAAMFALLMLVALLIWLCVALVVARVVVTRNERLRLHGDKAGLLPEMRKALTLLLGIIRGHLIVGAWLRLVLAELLLSRRDQPKVMFGMLVIVFGGHRIAGRSRIACELHVLFRDVGCSAANLDIRPIGLEYPRHRVLAAPIAVIPVVVVIVAVAHPLVVLTVSHVLPLFQP